MEKPVTPQSVAFIGGGNMTRAIVGGLLDDGLTADSIAVAEPSAEQRSILSSTLPGIFVTGDNDEAAARASSVVLSVKPQLVAGVCRELAATVQSMRPLIVSIAAGTRIDDIDAWLGGSTAIVRVMPNQAALLRKSVSGLFANEATSPAQLKAARRIVAAVGTVVTMPKESDIDAVTAISGSGPAYFFLLIDMIAKTGVKLGLNVAAAKQLAIETAVGAATLAEASDDSMDDLVEKVRSPGGTTAAALDRLEEYGIRDIFESALTAARDRASELADQVHNNRQDS